MRTYIFLIDTQPYDEDETITPEDFLDASEIDYATEITSAEQKEAITDFVNQLPEGMFRLENDSELVYLGGMDEWKSQWVQRIKFFANHFNDSNCFEDKRIECLKSVLENPLELSYFFVIPYSAGYNTLLRSGSLMSVVNELQPGKRLYLGNVLKCHI